MTDAEPILEFADVSIDSDETEQSPMRGISFRLMAGEVLCIRLDHLRPAAPLGDLACGIREPDRGVVSFLGEPWPRRRLADAAMARSRIGRVFEAGRWISNLNLDENLTLARRHHTGKPLDEVMDEVRACARRLGIDEVPTGRPAYTDARTLFKLQVVRALYNHPRLLIVERPMLEMDEDFRIRTREFINGLRSTEGTAVLFIANWNDELNPQARQARIVSGCWNLEADVPKPVPENRP